MTKSALIFISPDNIWVFGEGLLLVEFSLNETKSGDRFTMTRLRHAPEPHGQTATRIEPGSPSEAEFGSAWSRAEEGGEASLIFTKRESLASVIASLQELLDNWDMPSDG